MMKRNGKQIVKYVGIPVHLVKCGLQRLLTQIQTLSASVCANIQLPKEKSKWKGTGLIWQNPDNTNEFCKECPKCHKTIIFRGKCSRNNAISSVRRERWCHYCSSRGRSIYVWTNERRKYISVKRKGTKNPNYKSGLYVGKHKRKNKN